MMSETNVDIMNFRIVRGEYLSWGFLPRSLWVWTISRITTPRQPDTIVFFWKWKCLTICIQPLNGSDMVMKPPRQQEAFKRLKGHISGREASKISSQFQRWSFLGGLGYVVFFQVCAFFRFSFTPFCSWTIVESKNLGSEFNLAVAVLRTELQGAWSWGQRVISKRVWVGKPFFDVLWLRVCEISTEKPGPF